MRLHTSLIAALLAAFGCVCSQDSEPNNGNVTTASRLRDWGLLIIQEADDGNGRFVFFEPIEKVIKKCETKYSYSKGTAQSYREDFWGNPFVKEAKTIDGVHYLRIISAGRNGKFEKGNGDDLVLDLVWDGKKRLVGKVRIITHDGAVDYIDVPPKK